MKNGKWKKQRKKKQWEERKGEEKVFLCPPRGMTGGQFETAEPFISQIVRN
jgi:hypothetical protein